MTTDCICEGNWRSLVKEYEPFGRSFVDRHGKQWQFYGLVWGGDDFYYGMYSDKDKSVSLLSCVGHITGHGYELISGSSVGRTVDC